MFKDLGIQKGIREIPCCHEVLLQGGEETNLTGHCAAQYGNIEYIRTNINISSLNSQQKLQSIGPCVILFTNKKAKVYGLKIN